VVACLPLDPRFTGSNPAEKDGFLRMIKIRSTTSFGGEVKQSVPCRRFTACKRTLQAWNRFSGHVSHSSLSCFATRWLYQTNQDWAEIVQRQRTCHLHRRYTVWRTEKAPLNKQKMMMMMMIIIIIIIITIKPLLNQPISTSPFKEWVNIQDSGVNFNVGSSP
jgi:hypothetical protein